MVVLVIGFSSVHSLAVFVSYPFVLFLNKRNRPRMYPCKSIKPLAVITYMYEYMYSPWIPPV
jgi:hypothetical protein